MIRATYTLRLLAQSPSRDPRVVASILSHLPKNTKLRGVEFSWSGREVTLVCDYPPGTDLKRTPMDPLTVAHWKVSSEKPW